MSGLQQVRPHVNHCIYVTDGRTDRTVVRPHLTEPFDVLYDPLRRVVHFLLRRETTDTKPNNSRVVIVMSWSH